MDLIDKHSQKLYDKIRNRFSNIVMIDENGDPTLDSTAARVFNMYYLKEKPETMISLSIMNPKSLELWYDRGMVKKFDNKTKDQWFEFVNEMRGFVVLRPTMTYDIIDTNRPGLGKKDIAAMIQSRQVSEGRFSKLHGSKRNSYQLLEKVKIKVRHSRVVNDDIHGSRSRNIKALFLETQLGERFNFPFISLEGVRAMGRHLEEGGSWNDRLAQHILETTSNLMTIKNFVREVRRQKMANESLLPLLEQLRDKKDHYKRNLYLMSGSKGYHSYKENLSETYVTPVESIGGHFSSINPAIAQYLPSIERILGENESGTLIEQSLSEHVAWVQKISEQPASVRVAGSSYKTLDKARIQSCLTAINSKKPRGLVGEPQRLTAAMTLSLGITNPETQLASMTNPKVRDDLTGQLATDKLAMPVLITYQGYNKYESPSQENTVVLLLLMTLAKQVQLEVKSITVYVVDGNSAQGKSLMSRAKQGFQAGRGAVNTALSVIGKGGLVT